MTGIWVAADTITAARMNEKTVFIGTGAEINAITTKYPGMVAYCTSTGSGFTTDKYYQRNTANSAWVEGINPANHDTSYITTGVISEARLGSGTGTSAKYLRGDSTWVTTASLFSSQNDVLSSDDSTTSTTYVTSSLSLTIANRSGGFYMAVANITCITDTTNDDVAVALFNDGVTLSNDNTAMNIVSSTGFVNVGLNYTGALDGSVIAVYFKKIGSGTASLDFTTVKSVPILSILECGG